MRLGKSIAVPIILLLVFISIATLLIGYKINIDYLRTSLESGEEARARYIGSIISHLIKDKVSDLTTLSLLLKNDDRLYAAALYSIVSKDITPLKNIMDKMYPNLNTDIFLVTDRNGIVIYRANDPQKRGDSHAEIWGFDEAIGGEDIISASKGPRGYAIRALTPLTSGTQNYGVIVTGKRIDDTLAAKLSKEVNANLSLGTIEGVISSSLPPEERKFNSSETIKRSLLENKTFFTKDENNKKLLMHSPIKLVDESFAMIIQTDMSSAYELLAKSKKNLFVRALAVTIAVILAGIALTLHLIKPLRSLREKSGRIIRKYSGGDPELTEKGNEIETSVHAFDLMVNTIEKHIEKREEIEKEILKAKGNWEKTFNAVPDLVAIIDTEHRIVMANKALADKSGVNIEKLAGLRCYKHICGSDKPPANCPHERMLADSREHSAEMHLGHLGGDYFITASPLRDSDNRITGCVHVARDITRLKLADIEIKSAQKFLQSVIDNLSDSILVIDTDYRVKLMNRAASKFCRVNSPLENQLFCYQVNHKKDKPCGSAEEPCPVEAVLSAKMPVTVIHTHTNKDGSKSKFEILASPVFDEKGGVSQIIETSRDITNRLILEDAKKKLDERIMFEQKEQSIATLAGGIAHDFNNILMGVLGNAELLHMELSSNDRHREFTGNIISSAERMAELTKQMLAYARTGLYQPKALLMNNLIREALNLTHKGKAREIEVITDLAEDLCPVHADSGQMNQVFVNLTNNAFEVMEKNGGKLFIQTFNEPNKNSWECNAFRHEHPSGDYVHIRISDTGPGIPKNMLKKIFEPFFTTKFMGRGLGLAAASGIVQRHGGCISVDSELGKGTIFDICLPCAKTTPEESRQPAIPVSAEIKADTILIADDEPQILVLLEDILTKMDYKVLKAMDGIEALEIYRIEKDNIRLAILDIQMPGMDGKRLFAEMKAINPDLKVIISTGYDEKTATEGMGELWPDGFIQKPYRAVALRDKMHEILRAHSGS